ncbi:MAG: nucleotidyltransferase family protein [Candidatus Edwardsbacteria bacterium]|jgi:molybdenum cofactor cytidylyltransferase|nr:nucleotidyltransferase family protein [Candidatus Edwardsbacteria bacterium]
MKTTVAAIILAAGQGTRIGRPKLFLETGGRTFLEAVVKTLEEAGVTDVAAVVGSDDRDRARELAKPHHVLVNQHPEHGPLSSLRIGLDALPGYDGYLVFPVDHPQVAAGTIGALVARFEAESRTVSKPVCEGKTGHPVIIPAALAQTIPDKDIEGGLAKLIAESGSAVTLVPVDDPAVLKNINTRDDL